jgi:hypothetical protein
MAERKKINIANHQKCPSIDNWSHQEGEGGVG